MAARVSGGAAGGSVGAGVAGAEDTGAGPGADVIGMGVATGGGVAGLSVRGGGNGSSTDEPAHDETKRTSAATAGKADDLARYIVTTLPSTV